MFRRIRIWLIFKLVGDQPVIMNVEFADIGIKLGVHKVGKPILFK